MVLQDIPHPSTLANITGFRDPFGCGQRGEYRKVGGRSQVTPRRCNYASADMLWIEMAASKVLRHTQSIAGHLFNVLR